MEQEIYTRELTPFAMGGPLCRNIKTRVEEYEVIKLSDSITGILVKNSAKKIWHLAEQSCGAIIGTNKSKSKLIKQVKNDVSKASKKVMAQQMEQGKNDCKGAMSVNREHFFSQFSA